MKYTKYKEAIERHLDTCKELRKAYNKDKNVHHIQNIYYLCGYVIECSVFYALFEALKFPKEKEIRELGDREKREDFHWQDIEKHLIFTDKLRLELSKKVLRRIESKLPKVLLAICDKTKEKDLNNDEQKVLILIEKWTTGFRYDIDFNFSHDDVLLLHNEVKNIKGQLTRN